ncbi:MAG: transposase zinc-binding domain-containing protein [Proteobacteria bacterium]|nr:transposase zinc-binding domain-containing protein [Pseudomonadota bacterium]MBU1586209.1 transposase zinc-binding domain-containing protein [Pseudomonadota bacterium]MBU2455749.1 transposase zinc-binding domain-containing protein [Pseudomonadota bacterium]MBU2627583.1 transposase zinc-binding domain-containing protein [Pseudomonadota bacterium]
MDTIKDIITAFAPEYLDRFRSHIPGNHIKVIKAITSCRTHDTGLIVYSCKKCGHLHTTYRSCGNRHCPVCQSHKTREWLKAQSKSRCPGIIS